LKVLRDIRPLPPSARLPKLLAVAAYPCPESARTRQKPAK
jgi:hypothetical protein